MGLDRFANFISKSINGDGIEEININNSVRKIVTNHVIFDLNFIIYQEIIEIENEINDIIKIILCLPFTLEKNEMLEKLLKLILTQKHWIPYSETELEKLFDGFNEDEIISKFIKFITSKVSSSYNDTTNVSLSILELVTYEKIINTLVEYINKIHNVQFIQTISVFNDGIPSFSKVIEQRRRRIKNFLESNEKKDLFKKYFDQLIDNNKNLFDNLSKIYQTKELEETLTFDYFKWVKNRFSIDKSLGPSSNFIKNLEVFMEIRIQQYFPKRKIYINSSKENGESDLKIFKHISMNGINGDYSIHTTDSDLIHQILVQQTFYKINNKDINLTVVKYIKNHMPAKPINYLGHVQILESNLIIKNLMELYNNLNGIKTNNYKIIWDICLIFYFFGNDHLPSSVEIGPELGLEFLIKKHYQSLNKKNIVNLKKSNIILDLTNLKTYLQKINETKSQNITRIILQRFFKINCGFVNLLVDKLNLDFDNLLKFLEIFITRLGQQIEEQELDKLNDSDLRKKFVKENKLNEWTNINFDDNKIKIVNDNFNLIQENINFYESEFNGLVLYTKPQNITQDPYQDLYNYISEKAINNLNKKYPIYYDYIDIDRQLELINIAQSEKDTDDKTANFLKKIYHLCITQFGDMSDYHSDNITFYKYFEIPSIENIIKYISPNPQDINQTKIWLTEIKNENMISSNYLNSTNHHLLITPFISFYKMPLEIKTIISELENIENLWFETDGFNYRNINIIKFFKNWNDTIIKINLTSQNKKINEEIININLEFI